MKKIYLFCLAALLLPACQHAEVITDPRHESPEACYTAFQQAWNTGEMEQAFELLTPRAQSQLVGTQVTLIGLHLGMGGDHNAPLGKALLDLLEQRGFPSYRAFGQRYKEHLGPDENELTGEADDIRNREAFYAIANDMGSPLEFMKEIARIDRELNDQNRFLYPYGPIIDLSIEEHQAIAWQLTGYGKSAHSVDFLHKEGGWKIDQLLKMPVRWSGDNQYRDENGVLQKYISE